MCGKQDLLVGTSEGVSSPRPLELVMILLGVHGGHSPTKLNPGLPQSPFCGVWMTIQGPEDGLEGFFSSTFSY